MGNIKMWLQRLWNVSKVQPGAGGGRSGNETDRQFPGHWPRSRILCFSPALHPYPSSSHSCLSRFFLIVPMVLVLFQRKRFRRFVSRSSFFVEPLDRVCARGRRRTQSSLSRFHGNWIVASNPCAGPRQGGLHCVFCYTTAALALAPTARGIPLFFSNLSLLVQSKLLFCLDCEPWTFRGAYVALRHWNPIAIPL